MTNEKWQITKEKTQIREPHMHSPFAICHLPSAICHLPSAICHLSAHLSLRQREHSGQNPAVQSCRIGLGAEKSEQLVFAFRGDRRAREQHGLGVEPGRGVLQPMPLGQVAEMSWGSVPRSDR